MSFTSAHVVLVVAFEFLASSDLVGSDICRWLTASALPHTQWPTRGILSGVCWVMLSQPTFLGKGGALGTRTSVSSFSTQQI